MQQHPEGSCNNNWHRSGFAFEQHGRESFGHQPSDPIHPSSFQMFIPLTVCVSSLPSPLYVNGSHFQDVLISCQAGDPWINLAHFIFNVNYNLIKPIPAVLQRLKLITHCSREGGKPSVLSIVSSPLLKKKRGEKNLLNSWTRGASRPTNQDPVDAPPSSSSAHPSRSRLTCGSDHIAPWKWPGAHISDYR